jgi:hypothetical protein
MKLILCLKEFNYFYEEIPLECAIIINQNQPSGEAEKSQTLSTIGEEDDPLVPRIFEMETGF